MGRPRYRRYVRVWDTGVPGQSYEEIVRYTKAPEDLRDKQRQGKDFPLAFDVDEALNFIARRKPFACIISPRRARTIPAHTYDEHTPQEIAERIRERCLDADNHRDFKRPRDSK